jgi:2-polyprenyl-3-methyl-5-hydroxy-6-metoxy-1,4-benzoquinol methylase
MSSKFVTPPAASPFGGDSKLVDSLPSAYVAHEYRRKCGVDISASFKGHDQILLYQCQLTGYRFWWPQEIAGGEDFYQQLSKNWPTYYRTSRWEYSYARQHARRATSVLEVGCGRGYFLRSLQGSVANARGLELNTQAIADKVTRFPVDNAQLGSVARHERGKYDAVCAFQVIEHIADPASFLKDMTDCLGVNGKLILSAPNYAYPRYRAQGDAFDLPPHHMNHFDEASMRNVARVLGLQVLRIYHEPRRPEPEATTDATTAATAYKLARMLANIAYKTAWRLTGEPGANFLAVLQKPES